MPQPAKTRPKQKNKPKPKTKAQDQAPSLTSKKEYWIILTAVLAVVTAIFGVTSGFSLTRTALLIVTVAVVIGFVGLIRTGKSELSLSKRATFVFAGASVIGFAIWAAFTLSGAMNSVMDAAGVEFYVVNSLATCLTVGAWIGELLGRSKWVQDRLFLNMKN
jgi:uncharacterized ion transporter superfamily protein YfcC